MMTATASPEISWQFNGPLYPLQRSGATIPVVAEYAGLAEIFLTVRENGCTAINWTTETVDRCGSQNRQNGQAQAYPNPSRDQMTLELPVISKGGAWASVFNTQGELKLQYRIPEGAGELKLDLTSLPSGIYFLEIRQKSGRREFIKVRRL